MFFTLFSFFGFTHNDFRQIHAHSWQQVLCPVVVSFLEFMPYYQYQVFFSCILHGWLLVRSGASFFSYGAHGLVGALGTCQKCNSQHSWGQQVLLSHAIQLWKAEAGLARAHCYWVRNSLPAKKKVSSLGQRQQLHSVAEPCLPTACPAWSRANTPLCYCQYKCK